MELIFQDITQTYGPDAESLHTMVQDIESLLNERQLILTSMIVDGSEIYDDYLQYLEERAGRIKSIQVIASTRKGFRDQLLISAEQYLSRANPALKQMSSEFYRNPTDGTWVSFEQWSEGYEWIDQLFQGITEPPEQSAIWAQCQTVFTEIQPILTELEEAMKRSDYILLGDLFTYEILPRYEQVQAGISKIIDLEVVRNDLN